MLLSGSYIIDIEKILDGFKLIRRKMIAENLINVRNC